MNPQEMTAQARTTRAATTEPTDFERLLEKQGKPMEFVPFGATDKIRLTVKIVQDLIAVPTRSGKTCSDRDAKKFMMMCQSKRLNPFEGDAFLIGYDTQNGPQFSLITAHQAFLKRAEVHPEYDGMQSGVIMLNEDGSITEREGDFHMSEERIVGGWATVHFKNRKVPTTRKLRLERFNKGFAEWKTDPAGMIVKCAEADALRSSFPTMIGGLYTKEEIDFIVPANSAPMESTASRLVAYKQSEPQPEPAPAQEPAAEQAPAAAPSEQPAPTDTQSDKAKLAAVITGAGFTFSDFQKWAVESGNVPDADSLAGFEDLKESDAKRLLRAKTGLLQGLKVGRGQA